MWFGQHTPPLWLSQPWYFSPETENENMATHSSREGESPLPHDWKNDRRWCSASVFNLVAAQTAHVCAVHPFMSCFIQLCANVFRLCTTASCKLATARQKCRRWERNRGKRTYNFRAGNKLSALADVRGRRSTTQSPHPHTGAPPATAGRGRQNEHRLKCAFYIFF